MHKQGIRVEVMGRLPHTVRFSSCLAYWHADQQADPVVKVFELLGGCILSLTFQGLGCLMLPCLACSLSSNLIQFTSLRCCLKSLRFGSSSCVMLSCLHALWAAG